jgi:hypothetical protein
MTWSKDSQRTFCDITVPGATFHFLVPTLQMGKPRHMKVK